MPDCPHVGRRDTRWTGRRRTVRPATPLRSRTGLLHVRFQSGTELWVSPDDAYEGVGVQRPRGREAGVHAGWPPGCLALNRIDQVHRGAVRLSGPPGGAAWSVIDPESRNVAAGLQLLHDHVHAHEFPTRGRGVGRHCGAMPNSAISLTAPRCAWSIRFKARQPGGHPACTPASRPRGRWTPTLLSLIHISEPTRR